MSRLTRSLLAAGATAALALTAVPAQAAGAEVLRGVDTFHDVFPDECFGYPMEVHVEGAVRWQLRLQPGGDLFWSGHGDNEQTYVNLQTGRSWSGVTDFFEHDTRILEREGDVMTLLVTSASRFRVYDEDGELDSFRAGVFTFTLLIDTKGTATPEDDEVDFGEVVKDVAHNTVGDFCEDALRFTVH